MVLGLVLIVGGAIWFWRSRAMVEWIEAQEWTSTFRSTRGNVRGYCVLGAMAIVFGVVEVVAAIQS